MVIMPLSIKADTMTFRKVPPRTSKVKGGFLSTFRRDKGIEGNETGDMYPKALKRKV